jgi:uncharacterized membrane protein YebE (DUF533 family)
MLKNPTQMLDQFLAPLAGAQGQQFLSPLTGGQGQVQGQGMPKRGGLSDLAVGGAAGGVLGLLLTNKKTRKLAGSAAKVGGMALVGGLAYRAFTNWQQSQQQPQGAQVTEAQFVPADPAKADSISRKILTSMVAAARADGSISDDERARIAEAVGTLPIDDEDRNALSRLLLGKVGIDEVVEGVDCPEEAAEIYAAALMVIAEPNPAEKAYLDLLSTRLGLERPLVEHLHAEAARLSGDTVAA